MNLTEYIKSCSNVVDTYTKNCKLIYSYVRDRKNRKVGVVIAFTNYKTVYVGWSKCNIKLDKFNKYIGLEKAINSAEPADHIQRVNGKMFGRYMKKVPYSVVPFLSKMIERSKRYYK